jgi:predicted CxxxxCH...CXXCH cytochrome family protein
VRIQTLIAAGLAGLLGCSQARTLEGEAPRTSWDDVGPLLATACASCHAGSTAAAGYDVSTYVSALGPAAAPVAVYGDPGSLLLKTLDPATADATHQGRVTAAQLAELRAWVVDSRLSYKAFGPHDPGILNPKDGQQFHGALLSSQAWNLNSCGECHGADLTGGISKVACTSCHVTGNKAVNSCNTCHGNPPATGSHLAHTGPASALKLDCTACHPKPSSWSDTNHLGDKALVVFGASAAQSGVGRTGAPAYDGASCSNIYCHGGAFSDTKATNVKPAWGTASTGACGTCHGLPPASHAPGSTDCSKCHWLVTATGQTITNPALHIDGKVQTGDGKGSCTACHGNAQNPAPPRDVAGNTDPGLVSVGAHQAHLNGEHKLSGPVACSACHLVPTAVGSPGHVDGTQPKVQFSGIPVAYGKVPAWDHNAATCSATWCHGPGTKEGGTDAAATNQTPVWTGTFASAAACGTCHGVPPSDGNHLDKNNAPYLLTDCFKCHPGTVDKFGAILITGQTSLHINGVIDVTPTP